MNAIAIAENLTVSEQIEAHDVAGIAAAGYTTVICNRPDREDDGQPQASEIADACAAQGISFHHLPFQGTALTPDIVESFREILATAGGPVFAYCRSGQRSAFLWANAQR